MILSYVYAGPGLNVMVLQSAIDDVHKTRTSTRPAREATDAMESVLCAGLVLYDEPAEGSSGAVVEIVRRALKDVPVGRYVTIVTDALLDRRTRQWLKHNTRVDAAVELPHSEWLGQLRSLSGAIVSRQLAELADLQRRVRSWYQQQSGAPFEWSRTPETFDSNPVHSANSGARTSQSPEALVVRQGLCPRIADGSLHAGGLINARRLARDVGLPRPVVSETLRQLAEDGLLLQDASKQFRIPVPTRRDVGETYTARGLLGSAIVRRLALRRDAVPDRLAAVFRDLTHSANASLLAETDALDLELQDELARAADMPRIEVMFLRLTLQLRLFVQLFWVEYDYPMQAIVAENQRIIDAIQAHDADRAVSEWRNKTDKGAQFVMRHVDSVRPL
jgi:DNA-binding GntR family transcriptional regulator